MTYPHKHDSQARIYTDEKGRLWVTHHELLDAGYSNLESFSIVYLNGKFYELQGHANSANAWWVEEADGTSPPDVPPEA